MTRRLAPSLLVALLSLLALLPLGARVATVLAVCMGESELAGGPFSVSGSVDGAYITVDNQPVVSVSRRPVDPGLTPWYFQAPNDSIAVIILHSGRRTHLTAQTCYQQHFVPGQSDAAPGPAATSG